MNVVIKTKHQTIKIKDLFQRYNIKSEQKAFCKLNNQIKVLSPRGYKNINYLFRTQKQQKIKIVLQNGGCIKCGFDHKLYMRPHIVLTGQINSTYKKAKDVQIGDYIAIKNQNELVYLQQCFGDCLYKFIKVKAIIKIDHDEQILYDMQVDQTHEYFANGILSHNSWFLAGIGAEALKQDKKVLHYTLQLTDDYTYMRYDSILSGIPFQKLLLAKQRVKQSLQRFQKYEGNLRVKYYPTKTATVGMLLNHIKQCELLLKFKPDIIIIDYADLLKPQHQYDNSYHTIGDIYLALRGMAGILEVPIWSASQINRQGSDKQIIDKEDLAQSYKKIQIADFAFSISRKLSDKISQTARINIMKNRFGPDGLIFNADMDANIGKVHIYDTHTLDSVKTKQKMQNGTKVIASKISQRLTQLQLKKQNGE